jgi:hypothetical protein
MKNIILTFLIANAIFWGLFPDEAQCLIIKYINDILPINAPCPSQMIQILVGVSFYIASAIYSKNIKK